MSLPRFPDVPDGKYYSDAVAWAAGNGIASGTEDGLFRPEDAVTREQLAAILYLYADFAEIGLPEIVNYARFTDNSEISGWAMEAVVSLVRAGVICGRSDGAFDPAGAATRAEFAAVLTRFLALLTAV